MKIWKSSAGIESCRMYTCIRDRPSESTRKFALPNDRIARMRPLVAVSGRSASRASPLFGVCASTSAVMVSRRSNRFGYAATPSAVNASRFDFRC
ncbi:MAG: hypothetical protein QM736_00875 [Vicinamibacterales bacterium]